MNRDIFEPFAVSCLTNGQTRCKLYKYENYPAKEARAWQAESIFWARRSGIFSARPGRRKGPDRHPQGARQIFGVKPGDTLLILGDEETGIIVTKPDVLRDAADDIFGKMEK